MAASETSLLTSLGMTAEEYKETYGEEMDLSEKHLAWFSATALPSAERFFCPQATSTPQIRTLSRSSTLMR